MTGLLTRPEAPVSPGAGLLRKDHFQVSYVTNDLERACEVFAQRYGITSFEYLRGPMPAGGRIAVAFAWVGGTLYEIIEAEGPRTEFYNDCLPSGEFAIRFHHLGFLIHDRESWRALEREFEEQGWRIVSKTAGNGFMDAYYVEAPELGHYLEYIYPEQPGLEFFRRIPVN
jgi:Glyoxalase/Bleomycin resistance protein/Dioxygenase superfamily